MLARPLVLPDDKTLDAARTAIDPAAATLARDPRATIEPARDAPDSDGRRAIDQLADATRTRAQSLRGALTIERTLGEGGMGVVRLARQNSIGRHVAVKTLRPGHGTPADTLRLLREAWVTGALEHPNVVPVYDVGLDERDAPVVVLKRIEGVPWSALMRDAAAVLERFGARDLLAWNLGILMQACNAVHFAHTRGVLHRDLKPDNVMIGSFGEVYVLDWGLAVSLERDPSGRLPHVSEATALAGTPCYMAPEMFGGAAQLLSERTDVYLLGAVLYEILTGRPPHRGVNLLELLASALSDAPRAFGDDTPAELRAVCARALAREPAERVPSADALRLALRDFLEHRGSALLARTAREPLAQLTASLNTSAPDRARLYDLYGECRFGFRHALRVWPENLDARDGLREAGRAMVEYELAHGDARTAAVLLAEIDDAPPELRARVTAAERNSLEVRAAAERLAREHDPSVGRTARTVTAVLMALLWTLLPLVGSRWLSRTDDPRALIAQPLSLAPVLAGLAWWQRRVLLGNFVNRALVATVTVTLAAQVILHTGAWLVGIAPAQSHLLNLFLWGCTTGSFVLVVDRRLAPSSIAFFACFLTACVRPELRFALFSAGNLVLAANLLLMWRAPRGTSRPA